MITYIYIYIYSYTLIQSQILSLILSQILSYIYSFNIHNNSYLYIGKDCGTKMSFDDFRRVIFVASSSFSRQLALETASLSTTAVQCPGVPNGRSSTTGIRSYNWQLVKYWPICPQVHRSIWRINTYRYNLLGRREDRGGPVGGEGVYIVETRMFCTVCLQTVNALIVP